MMQNYTTRQKVLVGTIKAGVVTPSRNMALYIEAREANALLPTLTHQAAVKRTWDDLTPAEQQQIDALLQDAR